MAAEVPDGSIVITPAQFYSETRDALKEIQHEVAAMNQNLSGVPAKVDDHEIRLRALERFKFALMGVALVGGGLAGALWARLVGG